MEKFFKFILLILLFNFCKINSQNKINEAQRKLFYESYQAQQINSNESCNKGQLMLNYAQDNYEKALSYNILGECTYNSGDFLKSVDYLRKAEQFANKTDSTTQKLRILNMLIISYRRAGFVVESDENWKQMQKIATQEPKLISKEDLLFIQAKIYDIDEEFCKSADIRKKYLNLVTKTESNDELNNRYRFAIISQLCYVQLKCGRKQEAVNSFEESERLLKSIKIKEPIQLIEFYFMNKALINLENNNVVEAKKDFDSAYNHVMAAKTNAVIKLILTERLNSKIDNEKDQLKFLKIITKISDSETTITKKLALEESSKNKKILLDKENKIKIFSILIILSALLLVGGYFFHTFRKKQLEKKFQSIIQELNNNSTTLNEKEEKQIFETDKLEIIMNPETEKEILKNLTIFETKKQFNQKGISSAQMAVYLKTNTKYLTYILKKYRNSDFNKYINTCRIKNITKELHDNPKLLQYKISVISEMCGYTTHSQFTSVFKSIEGISPSQYINFLIKENDKNNQEL